MRKKNNRKFNHIIGNFIVRGRREWNGIFGEVKVTGKKNILNFGLKYKSRIKSFNPKLKF